jgi:hypothetical protein
MLHSEQKADSQDSEHAFPDFTSALAAACVRAHRTIFNGRIAPEAAVPTLEAALMGDFRG